MIELLWEPVGFGYKTFYSYPITLIFNIYVDYEWCFMIFFTYVREFICIYINLGSIEVNKSNVFSWVAKRFFKRIHIGIRRRMIITKLTINKIKHCYFLTIIFSMIIYDNFLQLSNYLILWSKLSKSTKFLF